VTDSENPNPSKEPSESTAKAKLQESISTANYGDEQAVWSGNYSVKSMAGTWVVAVLISVGLIVLGGVLSFSLTTFGYLFGLIAVVWVFLFCLMYYRKLSFFYELTTQRIKHREGFIFRSEDRIELIDISDVHLKQGPIQALFGVGNVHVVSSDKSHPLLIMMGIADARQVTDMIDNARREERRKRGLHIHSV